MINLIKGLNFINLCDDRHLGKVCTFFLLSNYMLNALPFNYQGSPTKKMSSAITFQIKKQTTTRTAQPKIGTME